MKPLFARFVPAMVSEQPASARDDARLWGGLRSLSHYLEGGMAGEDEVEEDKVEMDEVYSGRRDTAITLSAVEQARVAVTMRTREQRRGTITRRNSL